MEQIEVTHIGQNIEHEILPPFFYLQRFFLHTDQEQGRDIQEPRVKREHIAKNGSVASNRELPKVRDVRK